jgi:predicted PurR-regulated permease PerM
MLARDMNGRPPEPGPIRDRPSVARTTAVVLAVAVAFGVGLVLVYQIRQIIAWLLVATLLAAALDPAVAWLTRHRWRRGLAALLVSLIVILVILGLLAGLAAPFINQADQLITKLPGYVRRLFEPNGPLSFLESRFHVIERVKSLSPETVWKLASGGGATVLQAVSRGISLIIGVITTLTLMIMLLIEGPNTWRRFLGQLSDERRTRWQRLGTRMAAAVAGYVRGNLFISVIAAVGAYLALLILGVPYPVPLALLVGLLDIIPLIGATIGAVVCVLVAFTEGWLVAVILIGYFVVYQLAENHLIQPLVYSRSVSMSPLTVLLASLVGAAIAGVLGVLVAIPLAGAVTIVVQELLERRRAAPAVTGRENADG